MPVTYLKCVSDKKVRTVLTRIAEGLNREVIVHSGDRSYVPKGGSQTSLHLKGRAADFHVKSIQDGDVFSWLKQNYNIVFDADEAYEVIWHGEHTSTGGPHLHVGRYGENRSGYVDFKTEGIVKESSGKYEVEKVHFQSLYKAPVKGDLVSVRVSTTASVISPNIGVMSKVGAGGVNDPIDVRLIQSLLNRARMRLLESGIYFEKFDSLAEDGICGPLTRKAILIFQRDVMKMRYPDGRIDPGGPTIRTLYTVAYGSTEKVSQRVATVLNSLNHDGWSGKLAWGKVVLRIYGEEYGMKFCRKVVDICRRLGIRNPSWLMTVMHFETGGTFNPRETNKAGSGAVGLIQFMPSTAKALGTSTQALASMGAIEQLDYVERYFRQFGNKAGQAKDVDDVYFLVLYPRAFGRPDEEALFEKGTIAYSQNRGLDANKDGKVTVAEVAAKIRRRLEEGEREAIYLR